jgi:chloramphenicol O-acetyltransferase type A
MEAEIIDINNWSRRQHFEHFNSLSDPFFAVTIPFDVTNAYNHSKSNNISFFSRYLHDCMKAINTIDEFKLRIVDNKVVKYKTIHASPTIARPDHSFAFSFIDFDNNFEVFANNLKLEKKRIINSLDLFPSKNGLNCIHCSTLPWFSFTAHKEPFSKGDSVPKLAFGKIMEEKNKVIMNLAISVNHALVDGYHVGLFAEKFQYHLNN